MEPPWLPALNYIAPLRREQSSLGIPTLVDKLILHRGRALQRCVDHVRRVVQVERPRGVEQLAWNKRVDLNVNLHALRVEAHIHIIFIVCLLARRLRLVFSLGRWIEFCSCLTR